MSEKIDYDAYLKQLGDIDTNQKNRLKAYLEDQCKHDDALRACYKPEKMDDCYEFFKKCFEKAARKSGEDAACIEDVVGYKIARDYFIEILPAIPETTDDQSEQKAKTENKKAEKKNKTEQKAEEKPVDITPAVETVKEVAQQIEKDATSDNVKRDEYGFEVFGEEADEPGEETAEEPCHQEEVGKTAEAPEIKAPEPNEEDSVFLSGQAFNAGDIIDRHGRRLYFKDLMVGMRVIRESPVDDKRYNAVGVITKIINNGNDCDFIKYKIDSDKPYISYKRYSDEKISGLWLFSVPSDAMIIGKLENGERKLFEEAVAATADYDTEGNGLLFGF